MKQTPKIVVYILILTYLFVIISMYYEMPNRNNLRRILNQQTVHTDYRFDNPDLALKVLKQLDVFEPVDLGYTPAQAQYKFDIDLLGLKPDFDYCDKHRALFVQNTSFMFNEKNFISSYQLGSNLRKHVIPAISGNDAMPQIHAFMSDSLYSSKTYDMRLDTHVFFIFEPIFYNRELGRQFSCQTQMSNHIPGHENLYRKDRAGQALVEYSKQYQTRPQCFNSEDKFFPKTWLLSNEEQCKDFFQEFNSPKYQQLKKERTIVYFRKAGNGVHQGRGVYPVNNEEEMMLRQKYANGSLCGQILTSDIMQYAVHNPLLFNGRKADFRIPMLIASTNPLIVYYNDGFIRLSSQEFNVDSNDKGAFLTNLDLSEHAFSKARRDGTYNGMTVKELQDSLVWSFERVQSYLLETGKITDPDWLNNYFRPELKKMLVHLVRMSQSTFAKRSSLFEIFGIDVMLDENLNLWFIEANAMPGLEGSSDHAKDLFTSFQTDCYEVLFGLLRSRAKRIVEYVNKIVKGGEAWELGDGSIYIEDLDEKVEKFSALTKNYIEPGFEPKPKSKYGFAKIIDENYSGVKRYSEILPVECL